MHQLGNGRNDWYVNEEEVDLSRGRRPARGNGARSSGALGGGRILRLQAEPQRVVIDLDRTVVIVVDMQNDFCSPGGWVDYIGGDYAPLAALAEAQNRALEALRREGVPVIWLNWGNREDRLNLSPSILHVYNGAGTGKGLGDRLPRSGSKVLEKGSWGAAIIDGLVVDPADIHVDKYRMSGFWDTPMDSILRNLKADTLLFMGVNLDQCVMSTLEDAVHAGYDAILLRDCCATNSPPYCADATFYNIKQCYGFLSDSVQLLESIRTNHTTEVLQMTMPALYAGRFDQSPVYRISPKDSNKFVLLCDGTQVPFVSVVEIFDVGGQTPPNEHAEAFEYFYVLHGEGIATVGEDSMPIGQGSYFIVTPGQLHQVRNTGGSRLYVLTTMVPDEKFSDLIKSGVTDSLDEEDLLALAPARQQVSP
ncbi:isochorismatase family protein [Paenibacillus sp. LHD-117]|uniref:isochorismatase family protein n=1 Tax=Paenibacillus sp. LHD-117 TaxID=3071412 RepID=UPI0027E11793|nr:isochorismatase family protein [Paenibacillus sp. LHD-117]MDQ6423217.1 isochorismatase family protein [Paenibacillus sp. LHD-117]